VYPKKAIEEERQMNLLRVGARKLLEPDRDVFSGEKIDAEPNRP
jgi:hypothetical protein